MTARRFRFLRRSQDCALRESSLRFRRTWSFEAARALPDR